MRKFLFAAWLYLAAAAPALANVPCSLPFNLQNGTTADASQVMANYNALVTCLASAAAAGVNNDITQLLGLTTPLTPAQGGSSVFLGGTSGGSANAQTLASTTPSGFTLTVGYQIVFKAGFTNSTATTLTIGSGAATNIFRQTATGPVALTGNEIQAGQIVFAWYDGTQWEMLPPLNLTAGFGTSISGGSQVSIATTNPPYGFDQPVNMSLTVTANAPSSNLLQVCVTTNSGGTPSASSPVLIPFATSSGGVTWLTITASHCTNTNGAGATLGTQNSVAFRFWVVEFNNSGTPVLALWHSGAGAATQQICPLDETSPQTTTGISSAATSACVFYTPNGTSIGGGGAYFKILGMIEYSSGLATAGSYASGPSKVQLFGPGVKKPGDIVKMLQGGTTSTAITPTNAANLINVLVSGDMTATNSGTGTTTTLKRAGSATGANTRVVLLTGGGTSLLVPYSFVYLDNPASTSAQTYSVTTTGGSVTNTDMMLQEIMG